MRTMLGCFLDTLADLPPLIAIGITTLKCLRAKVQDLYHLERYFG